MWTVWHFDGLKDNCQTSPSCQGCQELVGGWQHRWESWGTLTNTSTYCAASPSSTTLSVSSGTEKPASIYMCALWCRLYWSFLSRCWWGILSKLFQSPLWWHHSGSRFPSSQGVLAQKWPAGSHTIVNLESHAAYPPICCYLQDLTNNDVFHQL